MPLELQKLVLVTREASHSSPLSTKQMPQEAAKEVMLLDFQTSYTRGAQICPVEPWHPAHRDPPGLGNKVVGGWWKFCSQIQPCSSWARLLLTGSSGPGPPCTARYGCSFPPLPLHQHIRTRAKLLPAARLDAYHTVPACQVEPTSWICPMDRPGIANEAHRAKGWALLSCFSLSWYKTGTG